MTSKRNGNISAVRRDGAAPPWHSIAAFVVLLATSLVLFPSSEIVDQDATQETFTRRVFPRTVSIAALSYIRLVFAIFIFAVSFQAAVLSSGWVQSPVYLPSSKLQRCEIKMSGFRTMLPFTSWTWNLLGVSFALNASIGLVFLMKEKQGANTPPISPALLRFALLLWEAVAPCCLLVSACVRYAIWPNHLAQGKPTDGLRHPRVLIWHNANVLMTLAESALLGGLPVRLVDFSVAPLLGLLYVLFTWSARHYWNPPEGPQFIYFFLDTTLDGYTTTFALLALLAVLIGAYVTFAMAGTTLLWLGGGALVRYAFVAIVLGGVCRFSD